MIDIIDRGFNKTSNLLFYISTIPVSKQIDRKLWDRGKVVTKSEVSISQLRIIVYYTGQVMDYVLLKSHLQLLTLISCYFI